MSEPLADGPPGQDQFLSLNDQITNTSQLLNQSNVSNHQQSYSSIVQHNDFQIPVKPIEHPNIQLSDQPTSQIGGLSTISPIELPSMDLSNEHVNNVSDLQLDYQSISQSVDPSVEQSYQTFMTLQSSMHSESSNQSVDSSISQSISFSSNQSFGDSVNRFIEQTINQSISQSMNQSMDQSITDQRQYARKALLAVGDRAIKLIDNTRGSNVIMRYSIDTVSNLGRFVPGSARSLAVNQWSNYGDPLLNKIDAKLDEAMTAIANATTGLQAAYEYTQTPRITRAIEEADLVDDSEKKIDETSSFSAFSADGSLVRIDENPETDAYWNRLKDKFVASHWYRHVDSILLQNSVVKALTQRMVRPAEVFFNTVTEEFLTHQSQEEFLTALQQRVGPAWDDRLAPLAKGFYTTAKAVSAVVGAGKFVGGALQLGRTKAHSVVEELLEQWDRVLGLGNHLVDRWLPDSQSRASRLLPSGEVAKESKALELTSSPDSVARSGKKRVRRSRSSIVPHDYSSDDGDVSDDKMSDASVSSAGSARLRSRKQLKSQSPFTSSSLGIPRATESCFDSSDDSDDLMSSNDEDDDSSDDEDEKSLVRFTPSTDRTGGVLIAKVGSRLRQRIPSMSIFGLSTLTVTFTSDLKNRLSQQSWFTLVDEILMQNALVKTLASLVRPAEHFFNTALHMFSTHVFKSHKPKTPQLPLPARLASLGMNDSSSSDEDDDDFSPIQVSISTNSSQSPPILITSRSAPSRSGSPSPFSSSVTQSFSQSVHLAIHHTVPTTQLALETLADDFVYQLRVALGHSWDDRLLNHARQFYHTAYEVRPNATNTSETHVCA